MPLIGTDVIGMHEILNPKHEIPNNIEIRNANDRNTLDLGFDI